MRQIDKEKFNKTVESIRLFFEMTYDGKTSNQHVVTVINDEAKDLKSMTDEELVIAFQLLQNVCEQLLQEQINRDLVPKNLMNLWKSPMGLTKGGEA